jgi:adenine phosphoribosyltransferase
MSLESALKVVKDFPKSGVDFLDISPILAQPHLMAQLIQELSIAAQPYDFDKILAIESRGFLLGSALAHTMKKGMVMVRKKGKLPGEVVSQTYELEYGQDTIEVLANSLEKGERVLILDDVLATGGTAQATCQLAQSLGAEVAACLFFIELSFLKGRDKLSSPVESLVIR